LVNAFWVEISVFPCGPYLDFATLWKINMEFGNALMGLIKIAFASYHAQTTLSTNQNMEGNEDANAKITEVNKVHHDYF